VTSREESAALEHLIRLLASDLSKADLDEITDGIREAEMTTDRGPIWSGKLVAELRRRGVSWSRLVELTGVPQTTLVRRVQDFEAH
jgi:hypothetical protein